MKTPIPPTIRRSKVTRDTAYILRGIDRELWARVTARSTREGRTLRGVILLLLRAYAAGTIGVDE